MTLCGRGRIDAASLRLKGRPPEWVFGKIERKETYMPSYDGRRLALRGNRSSESCDG